MINNYSITNIYEKPSNNSKLSSQMIYGETFKVLNIKKNWIKIKTVNDNYIGFIKKKISFKNLLQNSKFRCRRQKFL